MDAGQSAKTSDHPAGCKAAAGTRPALPTWDTSCNDLHRFQGPQCPYDASHERFELHTYLDE